MGHSISPLFQQAAFDHLGLAIRYEAWETAAEALAIRVASLRTGDRCGANVTVPHKEAVLPLLDELSEDATATGAVNTIVRDGARLRGSNTDIGGFSTALRQDGGFAVEGARVCVLGSGGAARAVVYALLRDGAARILIHNRTPARAEALIATLAPRDTRCAVSDGDPGVAVRDSNLIVNCTTLGMAGGSQAADSPLLERDIPRGAFVCDIVANPLETPLLTLARRRGCRTLGGLPMLVRQGAAAFEIWTGQPAPVDVMMTAARAAMLPGA